MKTDDKRILLIRCAPEQFIKERIDYLRSEFPKCRITILLQENQVGKYQADFELVYTKQIYSLVKLDYDLIKEFRRVKYDKVIIPCFNNTAKGYTNVRYLTWIFRSQDRILWLKNGDMEKDSFSKDLLDGVLCILNQWGIFCKKQFIKFLYVMLFIVYKIKRLKDSILNNNRRSQTCVKRAL